MLRKLLKYELEATSRILLPIYAIFAVITAVTILSFQLPFHHGLLRLIPNSAMLIYVLSLIALITGTSILMVVRAFKDFATREGYLTFTLPTTIRELIFSKWITAFLCITCSIFLSISSILLMIVISSSHSIDLSELLDVWNSLTTTLSNSKLMGTLYLVPFYTIALSSSILSYLACISLGHALAKNKLLGAFFGYLILYGCGQVISFILILLLYFVGDITQIHLLLPLGLLFLTCMDAILYFITKHFLTKKLNLE